MPAEERLAKLDAWQRRLHAAVAVERSEAAPHAHEDLIVVALAHSIRSLELPITLFDDLVSAFGQDTMTTRYDSWADVFDYCRRSANPVGRLVLRIAGYRDEALDRASDALCTALQLTNFWQDFGHDWIIGRLYVPRDVTAACRAPRNGSQRAVPQRRLDGRAQPVRRSDARAVRRRPRASATVSAAVCATSCASPGSAACGSSNRSSARAPRCSRSGRRSAKRDLPLLLWRAVRWPSPQPSNGR